jgi:hypothetical protein
MPQAAASHRVGTTVALLPLDDRPCNLLFPTHLAAIGGCELLLPPRNLLGWFTRPGDCEAAAEWLLSCPADRFVISLDMLCYGGLVAGRTSATSQETALSRLSTLRSLRRSRPDAVIFASSVLMRLGLTVTSTETLQTHLAIGAYSQLADRVQRLGDEAARVELDSLLSRLDPAILADYLAVRARNHALNLAAVDLLAAGVLDYLVLAQEDAAPVGLHLPEQAALQARVGELGVGERVAMHPGADEVGLVLMARQLAHAAGCSPRISPRYASPAAAESVPLYEHQPLRRSVESQLRAAGAEPAQADHADAIMFLHTPVGPQREAAEAPPAGSAHALGVQANDLALDLSAAHDAGHMTGLADVAHANGADPELVAVLRREHAGDALHAFAAWNTAGNTVGAVAATLCLAVLAARGGALSQEACDRSVALRLLDDYGYQTCVRQQALVLAARQGADPYALAEAAPEFEEFVRHELLSLAPALWTEALPRFSSAGPAQLAVSLPWKRLFEVSVSPGRSSTRPKKRA